MVSPSLDSAEKPAQPPSSEMTVAHMEQAVVNEVALGAAEMTVASIEQAVVNEVALGAQPPSSQQPSPRTTCVN